MPTNLLSLGTVSYNGFTFQGPRRPHTSLSVRPQYDSANRVVMYNIYTIGVTFYATDDITGVAGGNADAGSVSAQMAARLMRPGAQLVVSGLGYGDFQINTNTGNRDVLYGPRPLSITFNPIGSNRVIEVQWECQVAIAQCAYSTGVSGILGNLAEYVATTNDTIDGQGLTKRTIIGHLAIALNRTSAVASDAGGDQQQIPTTADAYREQITPIPPLGFAQTSQNWVLSEDKSRIDFTFVFDQISSDNAPPLFTYKIDMDHSVETGLKDGGFINFKSVIDGHIEPVQGVSASQSLYYAIQVVRDRLLSVNKSSANVTILINHLRFIERGAFTSRRVNFHIEFSTLGAQDLTEILQKSGVLFPVAVTDWAQWRQSMYDSGAWSQRGNANLRFNASDDMLIDLCNQAPPSQSTVTDTPVSTYTDPSSLSNADAQRSKSYLRWDNHIGVETKGNTIQHFPIPKESPPTSGGNYGSGGSGNPDGIGAANPSSSTSTGADAVPKYDNNQPNPINQASGAQKLVVTLSGSGVRAGFPVELPSLVSQFGLQAQFQAEWSSVQHTARKGYGGVTLYAAIWNLRYLVSGNPSTINSVMTADIAEYLTGTTDGV